MGECVSVYSCMQLYPQLSGQDQKKARRYNGKLLLSLLLSQCCRVQFPKQSINSGISSPSSALTRPKHSIKTHKAATRQHNRDHGIAMSEMEDTDDVDFNRKTEMLTMFKAGYTCSVERWTVPMSLVVELPYPASQLDPPFYFLSPRINTTQHHEASSCQSGRQLDVPRWLYRQ